jgi:hypothetical protein
MAKLEEAFKATLDQITEVVEVTKNKEELSFAASLCEVDINGRIYEVQIWFIEDKKLWIQEDMVIEVKSSIKNKGLVN